MKITSYKTIYFVGIKGVGMTALAVVAKEMGMHVRGVDVAQVFGTDEQLQGQAIAVYKGFDPSHIDALTTSYDPKEILIVTTGAHGGQDNPEVKRAKELDIVVYSHGEALGYFMTAKRGVSVAGTHGKTTTTAMIAHILTSAGADPSFAIGAPTVPSLGASGHFGKGDWFVAEADEYMNDPKHDRRPRFVHQHPEVGIITSIDFDHPDAFASLDEVKKAFYMFADNVQPSGMLIMGIDNTNCASMSESLKQKIITYGKSEDADLQILSYSIQNNKAAVSILYKKRKYEFELQIPGLHNLFWTNTIVCEKFASNIEKERSGCF